MPLTKIRDYVSVAPTVEPVSIEEARLHLDLDDNYYDSQLKQLIEVSRKRVEQDSRRSFVNQTRVLKMDDFPGEVYIELPTAPVSSVTHVKYYDDTGSLQTFSSSKYTVDSDGTPARVVLGYSDSWPSSRGYYNDVHITYVAGYGSSASDVNEIARYAILMLISHLFNTPSITSPTSVNTVPHGYDALIASLKWGQYP
jgi:uncharacterized phiE125 gp8 family phage protein